MFTYYTLYLKIFILLKDSELRRGGHFVWGALHPSPNKQITVNTLAEALRIYIASTPPVIFVYTCQPPPSTP